MSFSPIFNNRPRESWVEPFTIVIKQQNKNKDAILNNKLHKILSNPLPESKCLWNLPEKRSSK